MAVVTSVEAYMKRNVIALPALVLLLGWVCIAPAVAQTWPSRPIRIVVPFGPGGAADIFARILGEKLAAALGQSMVIDNRPGASGMIATEIVAKSLPDGYTIGTQSTTSFTYAVHVFGAKLPYNPVRDFTPVTRVALVPLMLVVHPSIPSKSLRELADYIKARPGKLSYASFGLGSTPHVAGEMFRHATGIDYQHVPYKGSGQAHPDLLGGQVHMMFDTVLASVGHVRSGRLRALGVTSASRVPAAPEIPTIAEAGVPGYEAVQWYGLLAPAGTPAPNVERLHREITRLIERPEIREKYLSVGMEALGQSPEIFAAAIKREIAVIGKVVKSAGIREE